MKPLRISLLALGASLWLGCSDSTSDTLAGPSSATLTPASIKELQQATATDMKALRDAVAALPSHDVHSKGNQNAFLSRLDAIAASIARGDVAQAIHHLQNLRKWVDGCATPQSKPDNTDKVTDCAKQIAIRGLLDSLTDTLNDKLDTTPDVTINQASGQADPATATPILFTVVFSEPVTGFTASDVSFTGSTAPGPVATVTGSGEDYTVSVAGMTGSGTVVASIPAGAASDADNNPTLASTSTDNTVTFQSPPPTVTINQAAGQPDPTTGGPVLFTVVFSKTVTGFTGTDVVTTGSTAPGTLVATVTGSGASYTVSIAGMTGNGTVVAAIPAGVATDSDNQPNGASTSTDNTVTFTAGPPTVTINQAAGQVDPTSVATILFTVQFSEAVTGFTAADISFTGSTALGTLVATVTGSGAFYTVSVTGMTATGTVVVSIPAAAAVDADNNPTAASTSTDNTVTYVKP